VLLLLLLLLLSHCYCCCCCRLFIFLCVIILGRQRLSQRVDKHQLCNMTNRTDVTDVSPAVTAAAGTAASSHGQLTTLRSGFKTTQHRHNPNHTTLIYNALTC
jgi:hypothetical protein